MREHFTIVHISWRVQGEAAHNGPFCRGPSTF
jgi:hypothetical protein